jgi:hypothetical protein
VSRLRDFHTKGRISWSSSSAQGALTTRDLCHQGYRR